VIATSFALEINLLIFNEQNTTLTHTTKEESLYFLHFGYLLDLLVAAVTGIAMLGFVVFVPVYYAKEAQFIRVELCDVEFKEKFGYMYEDMNTRRMGASVFAYPTLVMIRSLLLAVSIVYADKWPYFQFCLVNFSSIAMTIMVGNGDYFKLPAEKGWDLFPEFVILIINYHLVILNDVLLEPIARQQVGLSLIIFSGLLIVSMIGLMFWSSIKIVYRFYELRRLLHEAEDARDRVSRIDAYRRKAIDKYNKE